MHKKLSWEDFFHLRNSLEFNTYIFFSADFSWLPGDRVIVSPESVYDDDDVSDCDTPIKLFNKGYRYRLIISEVTDAYDDTWLINGGADKLENFNRCLRNYLENDSFLFPEN